jgi:hypothetical protein
MKQILIEKYIEPSEIEILSDGTIIERWLDKNYNKHSFMGQPAEVWYYEDGNVSNQGWFKKGITHRNRNLPDYIYYEHSIYYEY